MKSAPLLKSIIFLYCFGVSYAGFSNNIVVSSISLVARNTSTQTVRVNFDLS